MGIYIVAQLAKTSTTRTFFKTLNKAKKFSNNEDNSQKS